MSQRRNEVQDFQEEPLEDEDDLEGVEDLEDDEAKEDEPESARETVERILKEARAEEGSEDPDAETKKDADDKQKPVGEEPPQQQVNISPQGRLTAEQKEIFNKLPVELKSAYNDMLKHHEGKFTQAMQKVNAAVAESKHIVEAVRPYLLAHPELSEQGFTESGIVAALVAAHQKLTNPKTAIQTYMDLGRQIGIQPEVLEEIQEKLTGQNGNAIDIDNHPVVRSLQETVSALQSKQTKAEQERESAIVGGIVSEMEAVRNEVDAKGEYIYKELHDPSFLSQVKPLVSALVKTVPGITYSDALKRAYHTLIDQNGNFNQQNQARLQANNNNVSTRAASAGVSVRGKSRATPLSSQEEFPEEALGSARDTVRWALKQIERRGG